MGALVMMMRDWWDAAKKGERQGRPKLIEQGGCGGLCVAVKQCSVEREGGGE